MKESRGKGIPAEGTGALAKERTRKPSASRREGETADETPATGQTVRLCMAIEKDEAIALAGKPEGICEVMESGGSF